MVGSHKNLAVEVTLRQAQGERGFSKFSQNPVTVFFTLLKKTVRPE